MSTELHSDGRRVGRGARRSSPLSRRVARLTGPWLLLLPGAILIGVFLLYPLLGVVLRSFDPAGLLSYTSPEFSTINYQETWSDPVNRIILRNTFVIAAIAAAVSVVIAYPTAAYLSRLPGRKARILLLLALLPFWTSIVVRMYALQLILKDAGVLYTNTATVIGMVSYLTPYLIIIFYGGMVGIDNDLLRAARSLGASPFNAFRRVFFPLSRPVVLAGTLLVFIIGLGFFLTPAMLGAPSGVTVAMFIQQQVDIAQWGVAAAMGVGLLIAALVVYWLFNMLFDIERLAGSGAQIKTRETATDPGGGRVLRFGLGAWSAVVFAALLLPLVYVVMVSFSDQSYLTFPPEGFSFRWYEAVFSEPDWLSSAWLSIQVAVLTTVIATTVGVLTAAGLTRARLPGIRVIRALFMLPLIVPVVLIGAAEFDLQSRLGISGTVLGYALGHSLLALPFTTIICATAMQQLGSSLEEAARSLGASRVTAFRKVTLPLIFPSIAASAAFAFITSWDEPVMSLFLRGLEPTLPVHIFTFVTQNVQPTVAALSTLILVGIGLVAAIAFGSTHVLRTTRRSRQMSEEGNPTETIG